MLKTRILAAVAMCLLVALGSIPQYDLLNSALAASTPQLGPGFKVPRSDAGSTQAGKLPRIVATGNQVHLISNPNKTVDYWTKADTAGSFANPTNLGTVGGKTDYANASIASGPDGTVYAINIVQNSKIAIRRKPLNGPWGPIRTVHSSAAFMAQADVAVAGNGQIFVTWNEDFAYRYTVSSDGGNKWSSVRVVSSKSPYRVLRLAAGPGNTVVGAFGSGNGHVYAALWTGFGFNTKDLTPFQRKPDFYAEPDAAVAPNGKIYVAWRNAAGGLYYSERQPDGSWPISKLAAGDAYGTVSIDADANNNLHMFWTSNISGGWDMWYAYKPAEGSWQGPVRAPVGASILANANGVGTDGARAYGHGVAEEFDGDSAFVRYQQFSSELNILSATPVLDGGATITRNTRVTVGFANVAGNPDGVRYHWDAPPTDADAWLPFANPITVDAPSGVVPEACSGHVLYTQVKRGSTLDETPGSASMVFDTGIQGAVSVFNPNLRTAGSPGARGGDPNYTRDPAIILRINAMGECAGLKEYSISGVTTTPVPLSANIYEQRLALPGSNTPGPRSFNIQVSDRLGSSKTWPFTIVYDPATPNGLPVLKSGGSVKADNENTVLRTLTFDTINVIDNLYGQAEQLPAGKQFWGVWIANTTSPTATADDPGLQWFAVRVPQPNSTFSVQWSLFSGLGYSSGLANKPGDYYVFVRFLDGAGNPSEGSLKTKVTLDPGYSLPLQRLPLISQP
jgi:hypothetical protein